MATLVACRSLALVLLAIVAVSVTGAAGSSKSFNISNSCVHTVWPAISSAASSAAPDTTGFELAPGQWEIVTVPSGWSGRVWGRTLCSSSSTDSSGNKFTCVTGDCGSGRQDCAGGNAAPPMTLAQFTLDGSGGVDFYDVSLVDGYNLPMIVVPQGAGAAAGGNCASTGCMADLNGACPAELRVTSVATGAVACKSACQAFGSPQYCCTGEYGNPGTCKPSAYSEVFKKACPLAFSYAYDGAGSIFTCGGGDTTYFITFCASTTSGKSSSSPDSQPPVTGNLPHIDGGTTPYTGDGSQVGAVSGLWRIVLAVAVLGVVTAALTALAKVLGLFKHCFSRAAGEH